MEVLQVRPVLPDLLGTDHLPLSIAHHAAVGRMVKEHLGQDRHHAGIEEAGHDGAGSQVTPAPDADTSSKMYSSHSSFYNQGDVTT